MADTDGKPDMVMIATGSEVHVTLEAAEKLKSEGVAARVVSMPSWELFEATPKEYQDRILPPDIKARIAVEAGSNMGWQRYVGQKGLTVTMTNYGASAPGGTNMEQNGFTVDNIVKTALKVTKMS